MEDLSYQYRLAPTRLRERVSFDADTIAAVLDEALVCHVGFVVDGRPHVVPSVHVRRGDVLYLHGSVVSRLLGAAHGGPLPVCVTVSLIDGVVLARSAFHHSVNYRSVVVRGDAHLVVDAAEKEAVLAAFLEHVLPGRTDGCRSPSRKELAATAVLALPLRDVAAKVRVGPPADDEADMGLPYWAGVVPLGLTAGEPVPDAATAVATAGTSGPAGPPDYDRVAFAEARRTGDNQPLRAAG